MDLHVCVSASHHNAIINLNALNNLNASSWKRRSGSHTHLILRSPKSPNHHVGSMIIWHPDTHRLCSIANNCTNLKSNIPSWLQLSKSSRDVIVSTWSSYDRHVSWALCIVPSDVISHRVRYSALIVKSRLSASSRRFLDHVSVSGWRWSAYHCSTLKGVISILRSFWFTVTVPYLVVLKHECHCTISRVRSGSNGVAISISVIRLSHNNTSLIVHHTKNPAQGTSIPSLTNEWYADLIQSSEYKFIPYSI